uniref:Phospholipase A2 n=1 Tax=Plectus sambesii TaxID=2011161 RepID=A0A914UKW2_9BILA
MMQCTTRRNCADYLDHGCWCGPGNKAEAIVDEVDECCRTHDNCYGDKDFACIYYLVDYKWTCDKRRLRATCAKTQPSQCAKKICQCDAAFAACLRRKKLDKSRQCPLGG